MDSKADLEMKLAKLEQKRRDRYPFHGSNVDQEIAETRAKLDAMDSSVPKSKRKKSDS